MGGHGHGMVWGWGWFRVVSATNDLYIQVFPSLHPAVHPQPPLTHPVHPQQKEHPVHVQPSHKLLIMPYKALLSIKTLQDWGLKYFYRNANNL